MAERGGAKKESEEDELLLWIMEGYADTVIPPLSYFSSTTDTGSASHGKTKDSAKERERRETMTEKYALLQSMLPTLSDTHKLAQKEKIIEDTVNYIKFLEREITILEGLNKFHGKPVFTRCNSSANVRVSSGATFLEIQLPFARGSASKIVEVLDKYRAEVLEARIRVDEEQRVLTFTATVMLVRGTTVEMITDEISTL